MDSINMLKKTLGQFYTTKYDYILQNMVIPSDIETIIEPFAGNLDLLKFIKNKQKYRIECYDIDPKQTSITKRDTLLEPPTYRDKFILTNPPYLGRNKSHDKRIFDKYSMNDLYKCFIKELLSNECLGGILILPVNFWSSIRQMDINLRKEFLKIYDIIQINIFEESVFEDTNYAVCSFQFQKRKRSKNRRIPIAIYPSKKTLKIELNETNNYIIGGEIYNLPVQTDYVISRLIIGDKPNTNILIKSIDDSAKSKIQMKFVSDDEIFYDATPKRSARTYATLVIKPKISVQDQKDLVERFNRFLNTHREKYNSLFLTNYRESNTIARKRISFDLVYRIVGYLLSQPSQPI